MRRWLCDYSSFSRRGQYNPPLSSGAAKPQNKPRCGPWQGRAAHAPAPRQGDGVPTWREQRRVLRREPERRGEMDRGARLAVWACDAGDLVMMWRVRSRPPSQLRVAANYRGARRVGVGRAPGLSRLWEAQLERLRQYHAHEGSCNVPSDKSLARRDVAGLENLRMWLNRQRDSHKHGRLSVVAQTKQLEELGALEEDVRLPRSQKGKVYPHLLWRSRL